jgi:hypothetical protein
MPREYLTSLDSVRQHPRRDAVEGVETTEEVGDPDAGSAEAASEKGAAGGALIGVAVAGPLGAVAGGAVGAAVGAAEGSADDDRPSRRDRAVLEEQNDDEEDRHER